MNGTRIKSVKQLYEEVITEVQWSRFGRSHMENYRGHGLRDYKLLSGIGRYNFENYDLQLKEKCLYQSFIEGVEKGEINAVRQPFKDADDSVLRNLWYTLFQAQHLGLKTRLMDWSIGWETSLLFAVENEKHFGKDGSFWIFICQKENLFNADNINEITSVEPLEFTGNAMINSPLYLFDNVFDIIGEKRIGRQSGRFWIQSIEKSKIQLDEQPEFSKHLIEIIIDGDSKAEIKKELTKMGNTLDWNYYRKDETIEANINIINENCLG